MDSRSLAFVEAMIGIGVVGLLAFAIFFIARLARGEAGEATGPRWIGVTLAVVLLVGVVAVAVWRAAPLLGLSEESGDWRDQSGTLVFLLIMLAVAVVGLLAFVIFLLSRAGRRAPAAPVVEPTSEQTPVETGSGARVLGLLLLGLAFLMLNWIYVAPALQYQMMLHLVYPASLAVALVLLFDKATRSWSVKGPGATVREWLFCDALVFLLFLAFLNLLDGAGGDGYGAMICDFAFIVAFFFVFWVVDRSTTRIRFLLAYAFLVLAPILLLLWRGLRAVPEAPEAPEIAEPSWWGTIWPVFALAVLFFLLEIIALFTARDSNKQLVPAIKDAVFLVLYAILLIVAVPETGG